MFVWDKPFVRKLMEMLMILFLKKDVCMIHWQWSYKLYAKTNHIAMTHTHTPQSGNVRLCD